MAIFRQSLEKVLDLITGHPWVVLALVLSCALIAIAGFPRFQLDASADSLLLDDDPDLREFREVIREYGTSDFLIVTFRPQGDIFASESLNILRDIVTDIEAVEGVSSVFSLLDGVVFPQGDISISEAISGLQFVGDDDIDPKLARQAMVESPIFRDLLIDRNGTITAIQINLQPIAPELSALIDERYALQDSTTDLARLLAVDAEIAVSYKQAALYQTELVKNIRETLLPHREKAEIRLGGPAMVVVDIIAAVEQDLVIFGISGALILLLVLSLCLRRLLWVSLPLLCSFLVVGVMIGILGWSDWKVTVISSNFAALLMILTLSLCVHLMVRHRELQSLPQYAGDSRRVAKEVALQMFQPCLFAALTTMVAFASLLVSGIRPVFEFGRMMMVGMLVALFVSFTLVPAVLSLVKAPPVKGNTKETTDRGTNDDKSDIDDAANVFTHELGPIAQTLANIAKKGRIWLIGGTAIAFLLFTYGTSKLTVDNRFIDYFKESTEIYQGLELIDIYLGGTVPVDVVIDAPAAWLQSDIEISNEDEEFTDVIEDLFDEGLDFLEDLAEFANIDIKATTRFGGSYWTTASGIHELRQIVNGLNELPGLGKKLSILTMIEVGEQLNKGPLNDLEVSLVMNNLPGDLAEQLLNPLLSADGNRVRITMRVIESTKNLNRKELLDSMHKSMRDLGIENERYNIVGAAVLYSNMLSSLSDSLINSMSIVLLAVILMLGFLFRSWKVAILATIPNALAALVILGTMGLLNIPLDFMTVMVASISIGIAVDNTIHYTYRYRAELQKCRDPDLAVTRAHGTIGKGIYYTSFSIICGFMTFALSYFIPTIYFGTFTAVAMLMGLAGSLTLLPALYLTFKPFRLADESNATSSTKV